MFILTLLTASLFVAPTALADKSSIKHAGISVDFVQWAPEMPEFEYSNYALSEARRDELATKDSSSYFATYDAHVHFLANGNVVESVTRSRYFPALTGTRNFGNMTYWVDAFSQNSNILQAYSLLKNGERIVADPKTIQLVADTRDDIFTDSFQVIIPYPKLEPNSVALLKTTTLNKADKRILPWSRSYYPQVFVPLESFRVTITWEEGADIPRWKSDFPALDCRRKAPRRIVCAVEKVASHADDPNIQYIDVLPTLVITQTKNWESLIRNYSGHFSANISANEEIERSLEKLLRGNLTDEQKFDRIHRFVSQSIRYLGLEHGLGGVVPRPSALTLKRRYGDCKDKTALFVDLARKAGLDAYPVLTSTERYQRNKILLPAAHYFNHMIACAKLEAGKEFCVDLTDPYSSYKVSSLALNGSIRLSLIPSTKQLENLQAPKYFRSNSVETINTFEADGSVIEVQSRKFSGPNAAGIRAALATMSPAERNKAALDDYHSYISKQLEPTFSFEYLDSVDEPLTVRSSTQFSAAPTLRDLTYFSENDGWLAKEISALQTQNKHHDFYNINHHYYVELLRRAFSGIPNPRCKVVFRGRECPFNFSSYSSVCF